MLFISVKILCATIFTEKYRAKNLFEILRNLRMKFRSQTQIQNVTKSLWR